MVEDGINSDKPARLSLLDLTVAIADIADEWTGSLEFDLAREAIELAAGARVTLASTEPRLQNDWINVHGAHVAQLERGMARALETNLHKAESVVRDVHAAVRRLGWSLADFEQLASMKNEQAADHSPTPVTVGRALAEFDELDLTTRGGTQDGLSTPGSRTAHRRDL